MKLKDEIARNAGDLVSWRRDFHQHPETALEEFRTSGIVASKLKEWGIEVTEGVGGTGVVGTLRSGTGNRAIGLRADMDALPMAEENTFDYKSESELKMHACGHDGHTTMLLGAARYLAENRNFDGTVHFIFQPAEEGGKGAPAMLADGLLERFPCEMLFAIHNVPSMSVGRTMVKEGPVNAASDRFQVVIEGVGGHGATPERSIDPIVVGSQIVMALQTLVSRRASALESLVISVCEFHAGTVGNVIPQQAILRGTVRNQSQQLRAANEKRMKRLVEQIATANDATATFTYTRAAPQVVNAVEAANSARLACAAVVGIDAVATSAPPMMGGEDFAFLAERVPSCYFLVGQAGGEKGSTPLHHPKYDFNDDILPIGASIWATLVEQELPSRGG